MISFNRHLIQKREASLKSAFGREMTRRLPNFVMALYASAGAPDRTIIGNGRQTNWEFKHGTPGFRSPGLQELTCMRMATAGHCRYVVWLENYLDAGPRTLIVHPQKVHERATWFLEAEAWCEGFNQTWLVEQVRKAHSL